MKEIAFLIVFSFLLNLNGSYLETTETVSLRTVSISLV